MPTSASVSVKLSFASLELLSDPSLESGCDDRQPVDTRVSNPIQQEVPKHRRKWITQQ